jgi:hypothetical protein
VDLLGRKLTEREAKEHPRRDDVFEVGTHAIQNDAALFSHLARSGGCGGCKHPCGS